MALNCDGILLRHSIIVPAANSLLVGGVSAAVSKTAAAPIERVKLLIQNQVRISSGTLNDDHHLTYPSG